ncbi:hypothetical protein DL546_003879 [Coniochaeta pulveracea]|uniref:Uncharacterized protein n=1 Tax=Coniochaeta pulveracea TaxID=177199 RepID=A0A420Y5B2_9PEZI|nr:hypothetical protein DL546_003879 [Coniochaeta pulveracea]
MHSLKNLVHSKHRGHTQEGGHGSELAAHQTASKSGTTSNGTDAPAGVEVVEGRLPVEDGNNFPGTNPNPTHSNLGASAEKALKYPGTD